jgi:hypothetical protein
VVSEPVVPTKVVAKGYDIDRCGLIVVYSLLPLRILRQGGVKAAFTVFGTVTVCFG